MLGIIIAEVVSIATSICTTIGGVLKTVVPMIPKIVEAIKVIVPIVSALAELIIGKPKDELPEELALKAEVAHENGVTSEDFESTDAYINYLREKIELDAERMKKVESEENRAAYSAVGSALYIKSIKEKFDISLEPDFWTMGGKIGLESTQIRGLLEEMNERKMRDGRVFVDYMEGKLPIGSNEQAAMYDTLKSVLKESDPEAGNAQLNQMMAELRQRASGNN